ncbi:hypothetical protein BP6252_10557 [Coleophoma cylindrospora]|uniref:Deacetylase complex subunit Sds3 n=1 Tax=Coleophoma cylindrospora TaxID=1849047 RepID=A0A3D8QSU9_9HELO|nr:hypothetical protein BP6252_10557 [Coleophoma cylindrospora]
MALSPSPQGSPDLGGRIALLPSPPPQPSKRDKRRQQLADRLAEITAQFSQNRDLHCRQELLALQVDMHLITEADVHSKTPLDDRGDEIRAFAEEISSRTMIKSIGTPERAGKVYMEFTKEVNNAIEQRDADLATHMRNYEVDLMKINSADAYRKRLAANEHKALSSTLRDRLINSLNSKKARLSRDKETIEIGESNALLLHPSQFSIINSDSPSGQSSKRATRHRRDLGEDGSNFAESKRKRKAIESDESPAPPLAEKRARNDGGTSTPTWSGDKPWRNEKMELETSQIKNGLYSVEKLFTEKELSLTYNTAALAAHQYMVRHPPYGNDSLDSPPNGKSESSSEYGKGHRENDDEMDALPSPVAMERQYSHATRSTRNAAPVNFGMGVEGIADLNYPGNLSALARQIPKLPPNLPSVMQKAYVKGDTANQPSGLAADEASAELDVIRKARSYNDDRGYGRNLELHHGGRTLLAEVATPKRPSSPSGKFSHFLKADGREMLSHLREELGAVAGEPMSKQSSRGGASDMGGTPMSRQGTNDAGMSSRGRKGLSRLG